MSKKTLDLTVLPDGTVRSIYDDAFSKFTSKLGVVKTIKRLSHVEYENGGWTVRSARDPKLAVRWLRNKVGVYSAGKIIEFQTRKQALDYERKFVWELI